MEGFQQSLLNAKIAGLNRLKARYSNFTTAPTPESRPFIFITDGPFPAYPAPAAAAITILTRTVPFGCVMVINKLAIVHIGGGQVDGTGNVVWRASVNGAFLNGLENMQAQTGTFSQPNDVMIFLLENDVFSITAEVPNGQPAMVGTTAARVHGYITPIARGAAAQ